MLPWPLVLRALTEANEIAELEGRHCFIGKKLTEVKEVQFIAVLPPRNEDVWKVVIRFVEGCI